MTGLTEQDLAHAAASFADTLVPGDVVLLQGEMGAGKTTFVRYVMQALGSEDAVSSPTFTLVQQYQAKFPVLHLDLYRLNNVSDIETLDLDTMFDDPEQVLFVEWPEQLGAYPFEKSPKKVSLRYVDGAADQRMLSIE